MCRRVGECEGHVWIRNGVKIGHVVDCLRYVDGEASTPLLTSVSGKWGGRLPEKQDRREMSPNSLGSQSTLLSSLEPGMAGQREGMKGPQKVI